nr:MAG TPA: hypothetical protein [Caudoviricetes sp.]
MLFGGADNTVKLNNNRIFRVLWVLHHLKYTDFV